MPGEEDDFEEVDPDFLEVLDDGSELTALADEATSVGFREDLIDALAEHRGSPINDPLAAISEAAADLPEGIDALFDQIRLPSHPPPPTDPVPPPDEAITDRAPPRIVEDPDEEEFRAFMDMINNGRPKPPES